MLCCGITVRSQCSFVKTRIVAYILHTFSRNKKATDSFLVLANNSDFRAAGFDVETAYIYYTPR